VRKIVEAYKIIAIIGLSKNTGKTTTMNYLLNLFKHEKIAITSIGLDGEDIDQINYLPKPKIYVQPGMIVATAQKCLQEANFEYNIIEQTNFNTAIGKILVVEVLSEGHVLLAGPTTNLELRKLIVLLSEKVKRIFIDGAFNRKTFASIDIIDAIIMATGAVLSPLMAETVLKTEQLVEIFHARKTSDIFAQKTLFALQSHSQWYEFSSKSYETIQKQLSHHVNIKTVFIRGAITTRLIDILIKLHKQNFTLIVEDATKILLTKTYHQHLKTLQINLEVIHPTNLIALTINPYSPNGESYDANEFKNMIQKHIHMPIYNVLEMEP
jgi:hypothetical protein